MFFILIVLGRLVIFVHLYIGTINLINDTVKSIQETNNLHLYNQYYSLLLHTMWQISVYAYYKNY